MINKVSRKACRVKRHRRIRNKISGVAETPRLSVCRTNKHIYAQLIDDTKGHTLVSASTVEKDVATTLEKTSNKEAAKLVGTLIAKKALEQGITKVVFDRGGFVYHGKIKELAEAAREQGLIF